MAADASGEFDAMGAYKPPPPQGDPVEKLGTSHQGDLNRSLQDVADLALGRREFFGLLAWRTVTTVAGCILVGQLADGARGDDDPPPVGHACHPLSPDVRCVVQLNVCGIGEGQGTETCTGSIDGSGSNKCGGQPAGANVCRDLGGINTCDGPGEANRCTGFRANMCAHAQGANTCTGGDGANTCLGSGANKCVPDSSNSCFPEAANQTVVSVIEPPPGGG